MGMLKVLAIYGSPHHKGNSSRAHDLFLEPLITEGVTVEKIYAYDAGVKPCIDCGVCSEEPRCIHQDTMTDIYNLLNTVQGLSISSPIYFSSLPGPLKNVVDRCQLIWEKQRREPVSRKTMAGFFISTAGSEYPGVFTPAVTVIRHLYNTIGCSFSEKDFVLIPGIDNRIDFDEMMLKKLKDKGSRFVSLLHEIARYQ